jgi:PAS domain S-box-containing protein
MKKKRKLKWPAYKSALLFFILAATWVLLNNRVFHFPLLTDLILVFVVPAVIFFSGRASRRNLAAMTWEYKSLFDSHPSPMWIFDTETFQFLTVNTVATRRYGYSKEEFLQMSLFDIHREIDIPALEQVLADTAPRLDKETIWTHLNKKGEEIIVKVIANDVTFRGRKARLIDARDITEIFNQQRVIREMSLIAENTTNGVILSDGNGRIKWVNKAFEQTTGYTLDEVKGRYPRSFLHGDETDKKVEIEINELARQQKGFVGDIINYKKDGSRYWVHLNLSPVIKNGEIENIVIIQTDMTELKQQSDKIRDQYQKLRDVAFMVSHNARAPLTNVISLCNIIHQQNADGEQQKLVTYLKESANKLDEVIHSIVQQTSAMETNT